MPRLMETMKFPKYKHKAYPKWVTAPDGQRVKVLDERQEVEVASRSIKSEAKLSAEAAAQQELVQKAHEAQNRAADAEAKLGQTLDQLAAQQEQMKKMAEQMEAMQKQIAAANTPAPTPAEAKSSDPPKPNATPAKAV